MVFTSLALACCGTSLQSPGDAGSDAGLDAGSDAGPTIFTAAEWAELAELAPQDLPPPPPDVTNAYADDPRAAALGHQLFVDPLFSGALLEGDDDGSATTLGVKGATGRVSCAGCHVPAAGFLDDRTLGHQISLAAGWGLRRTPSLLDIGQSKLLMWDGRKDAFFNQPFGPLEASNEMNSSRLYAAEQIALRYAGSYQALFGPLPPLTDATQYPQLSASATGCDALDGGPTTPVCHGKPGDGAEYDGLTAAQQDAVTRVVVNMGKAIGAYLRLLSCGPARFDLFVHGDATALSAQEQQGAELFLNKGNCFSCHSGPYFSDEKFHNVGLAPGIVAVVFVDEGDRGAGLGFAEALANPLNAQSSYSDGYDGRLPPAPGPGQEGAFRTPKLRCLMRRPSFMHTAQMGSLEEVVSFFNQSGDPAGYPGANELHALGLTAAEQAALVAFLQTLEGAGPGAPLVDDP